MGVETLSIVLILRAFASGSVALTGVEAIANGVPAFKPPESKNAGQHDAGDGRPAGRDLHRGHGRRARLRHGPAQEPCRAGRPSSRSSPRRRSATGTPLFFLFQVATALILFLAANTSFNAFPRLAAILAEDGYFPRQFSFRGDRLAYSWGIILLAGIAAAAATSPSRATPRA